ncbi:suppressor of cytokine signaling 7 isoform X4 [Chelonia mydas]|uniref:suppressor of cytokine signaling 7 isoform X4 n=1 Tax=Chelonia mydas TaxID=8469 RepID=UPI0018A2146C|nr:suppressor of cytokine signaling 7 isoform X4 [Chelonia mydas]
MRRAELRDEGEAAAAASYRVLSRLLGYGAGPQPGGGKGPAEEGGAAGGPPPLRGSRPPPQLMVFRNVGRPGEAGGGGGGPGPSELLCPRHRCALEPSGEPGWGALPPAGLELQLAALELQRGKAPGGGGGCPCLRLLPAPGGPAAEETSDALLVLEALEPDEAESGAEEGPGSPGRAVGGRPGGRAQPPAAAAALGARKGSLKIRLSRFFRTKSCSGASAGGEPAAAAGRRRSGELPASAGSLTDVSSPRGRERDAGSRKPRLTRTQSAFSPVAFSPLFTGETVSLVDVDISQRGLTSPHPPTPPPPPRRSLSLLDAFPRIVPFRPTEAVNSQTTQHLQCPLYRPDASSFAASLRELEKCGWYWGPMNWEDAEMKLKGKPDGSFLVRDSSDPRYILSLSFRSQGITHHTRMEHYRGTFSLWCHPKFEDRCQSVVEFIKRAIMHSKNGKFLYFLRSRVPGLPPTPVQLLYPVSRFSNVKSLQHLCRFRIRQLVRIDHIPELPLPKPLISYIRKFYYYDPQEEVYLSLKEAQLISKQKQETESLT